MGLPNSLKRSNPFFILLFLALMGLILFAFRYYSDYQQRQSIIKNGTYTLSNDPLVEQMDPKNRKVMQENGQITQEAIKQQNYKLCDLAQPYFEVDIQISKEHAVNSCYAQYAISQKQIEVCKKITETDTRSACLFKTAKATNNLSEELCSNVKGDSWYFAECVAEVVDKSGDKSVCDKYFQKYTGDWNRCTTGPTPH